MPNYDFHQLTPHDLEILVRDLLQAHWGVTLESFKTGQDQGIDLRYALGSNRTIIQVKHYLRTGIKGLLSELAGEASKVAKLKPTRYVLVTSLPLSTIDKDKIIALIGPQFLATGDVLGQDDLNNLLGQHPEIEKQHFKLWLASTNVLQTVLHNAEVTRSKFKVRQVYEQARRYVPNRAYSEALEILNKERVVVIAGPPGVGKTTLADLLLYEHLEGGYEAVVIQRDVVEGEKLFKESVEGVKQIFYFDDFMGATFLGDRAKASLSPNDQALVNFIEMVRSTPTARLILTTREHIYAQALERSEKLRNSPLDDIRVFQHMPKYSFEERARILYNHVYFSDLPDEYVAELLRDEFYFKIVKHERFNPRLIEWLSSYKRVHQVPVADYRQFIEQLLRDPAIIWRHAYEQELTDAGRSLLLAMYSLEGKTGGVRLARAFQTLHGVRAAHYGYVTSPEDFRSAMREAANVFIKPMGEDGFEVIDPAVLDLMNSVVRGIPQNAIDIIEGSRSFLQAERVWSIARAQNGGSVLQAVKDNAGRVAAWIKPLALAERRVEAPDGSHYWLAPTYEHRLAVVVDMVEKTGANAFQSLIGPLFERVLEGGNAHGPDINDAVELMRKLEGAYLVEQWEEMLDTIRGILVQKVQHGCRADELRELISVIDTSTEAAPDFAAARAAFEKYKADKFYEDLGDCRTTSEFDGLVEDLELFRDELKVDVQAMIESVEDRKIEHMENEDRYADSMEDHYKDMARQSRASDRGVADMFGSLKGGRK